MKKYLLAFCYAHVCFAENVIFVNADKTNYRADKVSCSGNVIIVYGDYVISADNIDYSSEKNVVEAHGNIVLKDKLHNTYLADEIVVSHNFAAGRVRNFKVILADKSRLAAKHGIIKNKKYDLYDVIYTPCYECTKSGELTWQTTAQRVTFDPESVVEYQDASLELFGMPMLYLPYIAHVSPNFKRKTGLLVPEFSSSSSNGIIVQPKFVYYASDAQEILFKPIITSKAGVIAWTEYGLRFKDGIFILDGSITDTTSIKHLWGNLELDHNSLDKIKRSRYRGHLFSSLRYDISDIWRFGMNLQLVSDKGYLKRFNLLPDIGCITESNVNLEGFDGDNYVSVRGVFFQSAIPQLIPKILPIIERNYSDNVFGGTLNLDLMFTNLIFPQDRNSQKLLAGLAWGKEYVLWGGQLLSIKGSALLRSLRVSEHTHSSYNSQTVITPQLSCFWRYPLVMDGMWHDILFTPIVGAIVGSNSKFIDAFENYFTELNTLNIFSGNRSIVPYSLDSGSRICYGFRVAGYSDGSNLYQVTIGRSTELSGIVPNVESSGLVFRHSNIVGACDIFLSQRFTLFSRGSYCSQTKDWTRAEAGLAYRTLHFDCDATVFRGKNFFSNPFVDTVIGVNDNWSIRRYRGISLEGSYRIDSKWSVYGSVSFGNPISEVDVSATRSHDKIKVIHQKIGVGYRNECIDLRCEMEENKHRGWDLKPEKIVRVTVYFKNLGI